jgi:hypothetical protein
VANAAELPGPPRGSFEKMREFVDEIGPRWFPVEFDPIPCIERERESKDLAMCCFSEGLIKSFAATHIKSSHINVEDLPASLPPDFFRLGFFMERLAPLRQQIIDGKAQLGRRLRQQIIEHRAEHDRTPA